MMNFCTLTTCWRGPKCLNSIFDKKTDVVQYGSKSTNTDMAEDRQAHTPWETRSALKKHVFLWWNSLISTHLKEIHSKLLMKFATIAQIFINYL